MQITWKVPYTENIHTGALLPGTGGNAAVNPWHVGSPLDNWLVYARPLLARVTRTHSKPYHQDTKRDLCLRNSPFLLQKAPQNRHGE